MAKNKRHSIYVAGMAIAAVLLAACGGALPSEPEGGSSTGPQVDAELAPDFAITLYQGQEVLGGAQVGFTDLLGRGEPVVLNLWAGLCPPCRLEMPDLQRVSDRFSDEILLIGLDVGPFTHLGTSEDGQALVEELGVTYPTGTTSRAEIVQEYQLLGMPTTVFIKPDGEILRRWTGLLTEDKLTELVEELIQASAGS